MDGWFSLLGLSAATSSSTIAISMHNPLLVILSFLISLLAMRAFLELSQHILTGHPSRRQLFWILAVAVAFGGGTWSMHFTAILAYHVGIPVHYDWSRAMLSLVAPTFAALISLMLLASWRRRALFHPLLRSIPGWVPIAFCGMLTGASLIVMHYLGMQALHMHARVLYRPVNVEIASVLGLVCGQCAMILAQRRENRHKWSAALALALLVCVMHYIAMAGTEVLKDPNVIPVIDQHLVSRTVLGLVIFATMVVFFLFLSIGLRIDRRLRQGDRELERLQGYLNAVVNSVRNYAIFMINKDGLIKTWNTGATAIFYVPEASALGSHLSRFIPRGEALVARAGENPAGISRNLAALRADGTEFNAYIVLEPVFLEGECQGHGVFIQDLTHFLRTREQLTTLRDEARRFEFLANHDSLTGLLNRRAFMDHVTGLLDEQNTGVEYWLMLCDLDHFKQVNDRFGHDVGDRVLQVFAQRAQALFGDKVAMARFGGEEFMALLTGPREQVEDQAQQLVRTMQATPVSAGKDVVPVTISVGIAHCDQDPSPDLQLTIQQADAALYYAKGHGRNQSVFFELRVLTIESDTHRQARLQNRIQAQASLPVRVITAADGMQAISLANQFHPHLLLLFPPLTGIDVRRFLAWSESEFPELRIAVIGPRSATAESPESEGIHHLEPPLYDSDIFQLLTETAEMAFHILPSRITHQAAQDS